MGITKGLMNRMASAGVAAMLFAGCASGVMADSASAPVKISLRLDWSVYGAHAPFYLAVENGMYRKAGLDVSVGEGQGSATSTKLVAQGSDQMGFIDFTSMIRAVAEGMPLVGVMRILSNNMCLVSLADAPVSTPQQLEGKAVAFAPTESTGQMFPALLAAQHVDASKVRVITPAVGAKLALLMQKRADAITGSINVQVPQIEQQGMRVSYFRYSDFGVSMMNNGIVANRAFVKEHPEAVKAFLRVTRDAILDAKAHPEQAVDSLIKAMPQQAPNRAVLLRQLELASGLYQTSSTADKPFGYMSKADWAQTQDLLVKYGSLKQAVPLDQLYTNDYVPN